jgi:hypothetical protein
MRSFMWATASDRDREAHVRELIYRPTLSRPRGYVQVFRIRLEHADGTAAGTLCESRLKAIEILRKTGFGYLVEQ